ncbi:MAG: hypothetical protein ACFFCV_14180 [Promethearchaeota archaeon]
MYYSYKKYIVLSIIFLFCLGALTIFIPSKDNSINSNSEGNSALRVSDNEITLITPENKTYTDTMNGYYPGSYSFCNDEVGSDPDDFVTYEGGGSVSIVDNVDAHKNVVRIYDSSTIDYVGMFNYFDSGQATGTVEMYVWFTNTNKHHELSIRDGGPSDFIYLGFIDGLVRYHDGTSWINTGFAFSAEQWYRVKIEFNCTTDWHLWIDSGSGYVSIDGGAGYSYYGNPSEMDTLFFGTYVSDAWYGYYIDAIGYSWDNKYDVGDNGQEGLLVSFVNNTALDWIGYSYDNQINKTILGNYTIPVPDEGMHSIQIFANNSLGTVFQSDKRYFHFYWFALIPDIPENLSLDQGIGHTYLEWDAPDDNGAPILKYNIFRGNFSGGKKTLIGSTSETYYNDTDAGNYIDHRFYYVINAENIMGRSGNSTEVWGAARNAPHVEWYSPEENAHIIFPMGPATFYFEYDTVRLDDVKLFLNNIDHGSVWNNNSIILNYNSNIDGKVNATLVGYEAGIPLVQHERNFTFGKIEIDVEAIKDYGSENTGRQLYLILHDPCGDNSYSGFSETTSVSMGVSSTLSLTQGFSVETKADFGLFGVEGGASLRTKFKESWNYDFQMEITDTTDLTSNIDASNMDYIGPGYGDIYWGEVWTFYWVFKANYRTYYNNTKRWEEPKFYYGVVRSGEALLNDYNAPENWRELNPVHNNYSNVNWVENVTVDGGTTLKKSHSTRTTEKWGFTFNVDIDASVWAEVLGTKVNVSFGFEYENTNEKSETEEYTTTYMIFDNDPTDLIIQEVGIDKRFGTYIFRPHRFACKTSNPLEHNTFDYIPPIIQFPNIEYDTSYDGLGPCMDDSPIVTTEISDEGGIQLAIIYYSINDGANWVSATLTEQTENPGTWEGSIPIQDHGTKVLWYMISWDIEGSNSTRKDPHGNPYSYTVINRAPSVVITTPNGGEIIKESITVEWSASDSDGDSLTYALAYNDGGIGWHLISANLTGNSYNWDVSNFPYSNSILLKVIAYDGYGGVSEDISDFLFTIEGYIPSGFEFPFFETMSIVSIGVAVFAAVVVLRKTRLGSN